MQLQTEQAVLLGYASLLAVGGVIGFTKANSKASLIAGLASAAATAACYAVSRQDPRSGYIAGAVVSTLLSGFFGRRFVNSNKFMPSGLMTVASVGVTGALVWSVLQQSKPVA